MAITIENKYIECQLAPFFDTSAAIKPLLQQKWIVHIIDIIIDYYHYRY